MKFITLIVFLFINIFNLGAESVCQTSYCCPWDIYSLEAMVRHTEGKGIGYKRGYTTLEFMLIPSTLLQYSMFPFLDIRGQGLNDRKVAANAGIGFRYVTSCQNAFGCNVYYDFRQGSHKGFDQIGHGFQQIGIGFEFLSPIWDFRINLYQPICDKVSHFSQTTFRNHGIIPIIKFKRQSSMKGADLEVGHCLAEGDFCDCCIPWKARLFVGSYFLAPEDKSKNRWGGKLRLSFHFARCLLFEVRGHYDNITKGALQVRVGVSFPLYPWISLKRPKPQEQSCLCEWIRELVTQPVEREEIMPLRSHHR